MKKTYGAIDFTGETLAGPFWWQIIRGRKFQTIREPRKDNRDHVKKGLYTKLYWKMRQSKTKKPIHLIAYAYVDGYYDIRLSEIWRDEQNALNDGFDNLDEFRLWFIPDWFDCSEEFRETVECLCEKESAQIGLHTYMLELMHRLGQPAQRPLLTEIKILEHLIEPMKLIRFDTATTAKPRCPQCEKWDPGLTPVESRGAQCGQCGRVLDIADFIWEPPHQPFFKLIKDELSSEI